MSKELLYVAINAIIFIIAFIRLVKKYGVNNYGTFLFLIYTVSSVASYWYCTFDRTLYYYNNIQMLPFLYIFVLVYIDILPFFSFNLRYNYGFDDSNLSSVLSFLTVVFSLASLLPFFELLMRLSGSVLLGSSLAKMYETDSDTAALLFSSVGKMSFSVIRRFDFLINLLFFYQLSKKNRNPILIAGMLIAIVTLLLFRLLSGSRGGLVSGMFSIVFFLLFFQTSIEEKLFKRIITISGTLVGVIVLAIAVISISRFDYSVSSASSTATLDRWISQYWGEGLIKFNHAVWNINNYTHGEQNFSWILNLFSDYDYRNYSAMMTKNEVIIGAPINVFYTYIGDFVIDFGIIGGVFCSLIIYLVLRRTIKTDCSKLSLWNLFVLYIVYNLLCFGFCANVYRVYFIQNDMAVQVIVVFILCLFQSKYKKQNRYRRNRFTSACLSSSVWSCHL